MWTILRRHLSGDIPLSRAFWIDGAGLLTALGVVMALVSPVLRGFDDVAALIGGLLRDLVALAVTGFSIVCVWNAASRAAAPASSGSRLAPAGAKLAVILVATGLSHYLVTTVPGRIAILSARLSPEMTDFVIGRSGADEVTFSGALNDVAARRLAAELQRPGVKVLRVTSHGGLIVPVMELAEVVRARGIAVAAFGRCLSACPILLAASRNAIVAPDTEIAFHRPTPAAGLRVTDRDAVAIAGAAWYERFRNYGVPPQTVAEMARHEVWRPGLRLLAETGFVKFVVDGRPPRLVAARKWCADHRAACAAPVR